MTFPRLRITSHGPAAVGSTIEIHGQPIQGCIRSIRIEGAVDDLWRVHVEFIAGSVDIDVLAGHFTGTPHVIEVDKDGVGDVTTLDADSRVYRKVERA